MGTTTLGLGSPSACLAWQTLAKERQLMEVQQTLNGARGGGELGEGRYPGSLGGVATIMQAAGGWRPGVGGIVQRPYKKDHGFCVFWDYLTGLPKRSGSKVIGKVRHVLRSSSASYM